MNHSKTNHQHWALKRFLIFFTFVKRLQILVLKAANNCKWKILGQLNWWNNITCDNSSTKFKPYSLIDYKKKRTLKTEIRAIDNVICNVHVSFPYILERAQFTFSSLDIQKLRLSMLCYAGEKFCWVTQWINICHRLSFVNKV